MLIGFSRSLKRIGRWRIGFGFRLTWWNAIVIGIVLSAVLLFVAYALQQPSKSDSNSTGGE